MASSSINDVKSIIRGLLVSTPEEVTVLKLRRDFRAQEGLDIPFFEFGFRDVTSFLRSIPDVCQISQNASGPYAFVRLVESDKSAHVSSLVMRQRAISHKGRRRRFTNPVHRRFSPINEPGMRHYSKETFYTTRCFEESQKNIIENSVNYSNFEKPSSDNRLGEFSGHEHSYAPHNGYATVEEPCLTYSEERSEENCVECPSLVPEDSSNEFTDLESYIDFFLKPVLSEQGIHLNEVVEYLRDSLLMYEIECPKNLEEILRKIPQAGVVDDHVYLRQFAPSTCEEISSQEATDLIETENAAVEIDVDHQDDDICSKERLTVPIDTFIPRSNSEKIQRLERNLYSLMKDHCQGILGSELKEKYKMKFAAPLNFQALGCESGWDLALTMPHIFDLIPLPNGDFQLFAAWNNPRQKIEEPKLSFPETKKEPVIPVITKRNIQWLMQGYPNGLQSKDFEQTYKDTFLGGIELKQMGFSSMKEFLKCLEKMNVLKIQISESDVWLLPSLISSNIAVEDPLPSQELMSTQVDMKTFSQRFPPDVIGPDTHIEQVEIPSWIQKSSMIEVFVQEVNNPHNFWVTFCGEQYTRALDSLMDDLQAFYCSKSHSYKMPKDLIREGQDCVTQYVEEWHRARITCIVSSSEVEVCFYDYGTRRIVQKDNIHYLHTAHSTLPAQAIRAVLANIAPVEDKWSREASKRFLHLIANKALIGIVKAVDRQNSVFSVFLCDTSGEDDVYVHEVLIAEGFAAESAITFSETETQNDVKTENHQSFLVFEQEEIKQKEKDLDSFIININIPEKEYTTSDSSQENLKPNSDIIQEMPIEDFSRKLSHHSLSKKSSTDAIKDPISVLPSTSSPTAVCAPIVSKICSKSATIPQSIAPPPGFSQVSKSISESGVCDKRESQVCGSHSMFDEPKKLDAEEVEADHTNQTLKYIEDVEKHIPEISSHKKKPHRESVKGVSSGVNANFAQNKASYVPNSYTYPNWTPAPQAFQNFQAFSAIPPVNVNSSLATLQFGTFPLQSLPNPLDYCNMWYYEQCRQQAFLQGMLVHQQMSASAFPPLPPGIYVPNSYPPLNSQPLPQNHMNISEVYPSEPSPPVNNLNLDKHSAECQVDIICSATQTDILSVCESSDEELKTTEVQQAKVSLLDTVSHADSQANQDNAQLHKHSNCYDSQVNNNPFNNTFEDESSFKRENSYLQTTVTQTFDSCETNLKINSITNYSENEIKSESDDEKSAIKNVFVDSHNSTSPDAIQSESENVSESNSSEKSLHGSKISLVKSTTSEEFIEIMGCNKVRGSESNSYLNTDSSEQKLQIICDSKSVENVPSNKDLNEENRVRSVVNTVMEIPKQSSLIVLSQKNSVVDKEEKELSQVIYANSLNHEETSCNEDDSHEHEMIEKAEQEYVTNESNFEKKENFVMVNSESMSQAVIVPENLPSEENLDLSKGENINVSLKLTQSPSPFALSDQSSAKQSREMKEESNNDQTDNVEASVNRLLKFNQQLTVQRLSEGNSEVSRLTSHFSKHEENPQKPCSTSGVVLGEFGALTISNVPPNVNMRVSDVQNNFPSNNEERVVEPIPKTQKTFSKIKQVRPVLGAKLSDEVSASIIPGPTQPAMTQKPCLTSPPHSPKQTKNSSSHSDVKPSAQPLTWKTTWVPEEVSRSEEVNRPAVPKQINHESSRNVAISSTIRNLSKQATSNRQKESRSSSKQGTNHQFVKKINLSKKDIHQINLDGRPYVLTDEIVGHFTPFNGRHVILKILEARKVEINFLEMSRRRRPEFFECLDKSDIQCISRGPTGNVIGSVHMVPLRSIPYMLRALNKDDATLSEDVKEEMEKFDPNDPYWTGCCD